MKLWIKLRRTPSVVLYMLTAILSAVAMFVLWVGICMDVENDACQENQPDHKPVGPRQMAVEDEVAKN